MITINKEFVEYAEKEMVSWVLRFSNQMEERDARKISNKIVSLVDWNNPVLMHKGLSWFAKNYLIQHKMI